MSTFYRGSNRYRTFLKAGKIIAAKIAPLPGVVGVLGAGSIGRRFGDKYSDLDLIVYAHHHARQRLERLVSVGWTSYRGMDFDIPVMCYETAVKAKVPSKYWTQVVRWDHQQSQILHDTDNRIRRLLQEKLIYPEEERKRLLDKCQQEVHEHLVFLPELWADRGSLYNVIDTLMRGVQSMVLWIYAKNKVFEPHVGKWLFFHLETKAVPEHEFLDELTQVHGTVVRSTAGAMRIRENLLGVCDRIGLKWEVYSWSEAHRRCVSNWEKASQKTKAILKW